MSLLQKTIIGIASVFLLIGIWQVFQFDVTQFFPTFGFYALSFAGYIFLIYFKKNISFNFFLGLFVLLSSICFLFVPNLSVDFWRFLWDGELISNGINPFDFTPLELQENGFINSDYRQELFTGLSDLSKKNYSCYPPINQFYFWISTIFTDSVAVNLFLMRFSILLTEIIGLIYLMKSFKLLKIEQNRVWILFLNPLFLIETIGNVHFEGVMLSWLIVAFYFILQKKWLLAGLFFSVAVQIKLVPLILLPFILRYLGWTKSIGMYSITLIGVFLFSLILIGTDNYLNFFQSLQLYFRSFDFNSLIYHNYMEYWKGVFGFYPNRTYGFKLTQIPIFFILVLAFFDENPSSQRMFNRMLFGFFIYLLFTSTVHPWYVLTLLTIGVFTKYSFPIWWTFLVFVSYFFYQNGDVNSFEVRLSVHLEYLILLLIVLVELIRGVSILPSNDGHSDNQKN